MSPKLLNFRSLIRDFLVNLFAGLIGAGIIGLISGKPWIGIVLFFLFIGVVAIYLILKKYERMIKFIRAGAYGYYYSFPVEENLKVWKEVKKDFKYLGISADSILPRFRDWAEGLPINSPHKFLFLLVDPASMALKQQICHQRNLDALNSQLESELKVVQERIRTSIELLKNTKLYKEGKLKLRTYNEFIPWWMYIFDDEKIYLGILPKGKAGLDSPVLIMKKSKDFTTLFNAFENTWIRMWESGKDA